MEIYSFPNVKETKVIKDIKISALENNRIKRLSPYLYISEKEDSFLDDSFRDFAQGALLLKDEDSYMEEAGLCYILDNKIMAALYFGVDYDGVVLENMYISQKEETLGKRAFLYLFKKAYEILKEIDANMAEKSNNKVCFYHYMIFGDKIKTAVIREIMTGIQPVNFIEDPLLLDALLEEAINDNS